MVCTNYKVLLIEDDELDQMAFQRFIESEKLLYDYTMVSSISEAQSVLNSEKFDIIITDYTLGDGTALDILDLVKDIPIVLTTGTRDEDVAVKAWKAGAYDYLSKDIEGKYIRAIPKTIENAIKRREIEEALDRRQKNLVAIFDAVPIGMFSANENMIVTQANNAVRQIFHKQDDEIIGQPVGDVINCIHRFVCEQGCGHSPACMGCLFRKTITNVLDSGQSILGLEIRPTLEIDEKEITSWYSLSAKPVIIDGNRHVIVTIDEITERKKTEELLQASNQQLQSEITERKQIEEELSKHRVHLEELVAQRTTSLEKSNEKLARSNTELREFVYIASHDLREPLRKISSFGELVKDSLGEGLEENDKENLDFMIDGAERMTQMIEALLVYSRLNTKDITLSTVDLNEIIEQFSLLELATLLEETKATIEVPQSLPIVKADKVLVRQLMQNLISNGIKYQKPGTAPRIEITAKQIDNDKVRIEFKDNGIGIKKEMHQTIFKMFKRVHSREEYQGTGIGLAVCKKIAERHGSQIGVDSEEGKGSVFWFTMSLEKELATVS